MKNNITRILKFLLRTLNSDKFITAGQAITLLVLSQAFPEAIQLGSNTILSALLGAIFVSVSLAGSVPITFALFDYTKVGEYKLSLKQLSAKEKLLIITLTMLLGAAGLQFLSFVFPSVITFSTPLAALLVTVTCEVVSLGIDRAEDIFLEKDNDEGFVRQGKRKCKPKTRSRKRK